jgi:hypothetical protein
MLTHVSLAQSRPPKPSFCRRLISRLLGVQKKSEEQQLTPHAKTEEEQLRDNVLTIVLSTSSLQLSLTFLAVPNLSDARLQSHRELLDEWMDNVSLIEAALSKTNDVDFLMRIEARLILFVSRIDHLLAQLEGGAFERDNLERMYRDAANANYILHRLYEMRELKKFSASSLIHNRKFRKSYTDILLRYYEMIQREDFNSTFERSPSFQEWNSTFRKNEIQLLRAFRNYASHIFPRELLIEAEHYLELYRVAKTEEPAIAPYFHFVTRLFCNALINRIRIAERLSLVPIDFYAEPGGRDPTGIEREFDELEKVASEILNKLATRPGK